MRTIGKVKEDKHGGGTGKDKIGACKKEWRNKSENGKDMSGKEVSMKGCENERTGLWAWMKY